ncbi:dihydrodipicolinate synthase family protein [Paenibacillus sp. NPDC057967]|uniref:dihydrodipicolinate synthase family protein n=1 Tax=Paenibacillus sp. NPDC057967 TaxID=3346293 RepID=UPI0036D7EBD0
MLTTHSLRGLFVPVVTPFDEQGKLDWLSYEKLLDRLVGSGIQGLVLNGVTGEASSLTDHELEALIRIARDASRDIPVIAGIGYSKASTTDKRIGILKELGAEGALVPLSSLHSSLQKTFTPLLEELTTAGLPVILHDLPVPGERPIAIEQVLSLLEYDQIIGIKTSTGDIRRLFKLARSSEKSVLCGEDALFYASLSCGAKGGILASSNLDSDSYLRIVEQFRAGYIPDAGLIFDQLTPLIRFLCTEPSPAPLKWLLAQQGYIRSGKLRLKA